MICKELPVPYSKKNIHIFGTDICGKSIETARNGIYSNFELQRGLDELRIKKFFTIDKFGNRVCDSLRSLVEFRVSNLFDRSQGLGGSFDLVLCRNVAIYFSGEKKIELYKNLATALRRGGILVLGVTESMVDLPGLFRMEVLDNCSFYVRV
jgi:chemotaxis protein methyltransferase CheR